MRRNLATKRSGEVLRAVVSDLAGCNGDDINSQMLREPHQCRDIARPTVNAA